MAQVRAPFGSGWEDLDTFFAKRARGGARAPTGPPTRVKCLFCHGWNHLMPAEAAGLCEPGGVSIRCSGCGKKQTHTWVRKENRKP